MLPRLAAILILCLSFSVMRSQSFICGTEVPSNANALEQKSAVNKTFAYQSISTCLHKTLSIHVIIVTDSLNSPGVTPGLINQAVTYMNGFYAPVCLSFQVCSIDTVYSYRYNRWNRTTMEAEFKVLYGKENVINLVLVSTILVPGGAVGYAPLGILMPPAPRKDIICIEKASITPTCNVLPHEMGHYFGLYHPFETSLGVELVNESNCATTGDLLCDTPAAINPSPISGGCTWIGTTRDPNGDLYTPSMGNIMSYDPAGCTPFFTTGQYNRIIFAYLNFRTYLY